MRTKGLKTNTTYTKANVVKLVHGGKEFFDLLLQLTASAQHTIFLQFYIFLNDETGTSVIEALKAAAKRNVSVYLHIDSYASRELSVVCIKEMEDAGIHVKLFEPLFRGKHFYFGRRLHHKVLVSDGIYSVVGGINICNKYNDMPENPAWLDMALYCEGEASLKVEQICLEMWNSRSVKAIKTKRSVRNKYKEEVLVRVRQNDWVKRKKGIWKSYLEMFANAEKNITIMCSYFLPGRLFRRQLKAAIKRGVEVQIVLAGVSDVLMAKHAERHLYSWMFRNNIKIYEYKETVLHSKIAVYDSTWVTIGSYNVNGLSAHASLEINMDVQNDAFATTVKNDLDLIIKEHCEQITEENYSSSTNIFRRLWQWTCYNIANKMLFIITFYLKQEK